MKIQRGHCVPKELITSEVLHEAVVKCFVAAGFKKDGEFGNMPYPDYFSGLGVDEASNRLCWTNDGEPLTLQQLFTAENGLQWLDWAECVQCGDDGVFFTSANKGVIQFISGSFYQAESIVLATRQSNALSQPQSLTHSEEVLTHSEWRERGELPPAGAYCQFQLTDGSGNWVNCFIIGVDDLGFCVCRADMDYFASMSASSFRPICTEREKLIDLIVSVGNQSDGVLADAILTAGFRIEKRRGE